MLKKSLLLIVRGVKGAVFRTKMAPPPPVASVELLPVKMLFAMETTSGIDQPLERMLLAHRLCPPRVGP